MMEKRNMKIVTTSLFVVIMLAGMLAITPAASAAPTKVICVPWQGDINKHHTTWSGQNINLKCVVHTDTTSQIWYQWNFGDGSTSAIISLSGATKYNVEIKHIYTDALDKPFTAQLTVADNNALANPITDRYLVKIQENKLDSKINVAIDDGLWYLYKQGSDASSSYKSFDGSPVMVWSYSSYYTSPTASAVHAFEINGHKETGNPDEDPYVTSVDRGLNWLFKGYYSSTSYPMLEGVAINAQTYGNPDSNANGKGIQARDYGYRPVYESGQVMDAIVASGTPDASTGRDINGDGVIDTYKDVVQDMIDMYAWGQSDHATYGGGWRYNWNEALPDNSAAQWAAIGIIAAEQTPAHKSAGPDSIMGTLDDVVIDYWGTVPQWVKDRNNVWLDYSYLTPVSGNANWGGFGYTGKGYGDATTPSGMVQLDFDDKTTTDARWVRTERWFADNWKDVGRDWLDQRNMYAYYAFAKAMRLANPDPVVLFSSNGFDWYRGNGVTMGLAEKISSDMISTGGVWNYNVWAGPILETAWGVIILKPVLFTEAPIACFDADPNPSYPDMDINFDPSCSGHGEEGKSIKNLVKFEWDWNNDGVYDQSTTTPDEVTHKFNCPTIPCTYPVKLQVTDDNVPAGTHTYSMDILITNPPHPPVARIKTPMMVSLDPDDSLTLDGSNSYDPDEGTHQAGCDACPDDTITAMDWDIDYDGAFDDATGEVVTLDHTGYSAYFGTANDYNIGLRVKDNTAASYPDSGEPDFKDEYFAAVGVYDTDNFGLKADTSCLRVVLSWNDLGADNYIIYKSLEGINTGFEDTANTIETTKGLSVSLDTTYYFRIMAIKGNNKYLSKAIEVFADQHLCDPTANPGGPYKGCVGEPVTLDGSGSTALTGTVVTWEWELDGDGNYDDAIGETTPWTWNSEGIFDVGLRATSSDSAVLTDEASTTAEIKSCAIPQPDLGAEKYRWSVWHTDPDYKWDTPKLFHSWNDVWFTNKGTGDAKNVMATITCKPVNVVVKDGVVAFGDIPAGGSAWSKDFFELVTDMGNPQDPKLGILWQVEYDDDSGQHHVVPNVPKFRGEDPAIICPQP